MGRIQAFAAEDMRQLAYLMQAHELGQKKPRTKTRGFFTQKVLIR